MGDPMAGRSGPQVFVVIVTQLVTPPLPSCPVTWRQLTLKDQYAWASVGEGRNQ